MQGVLIILHSTLSNQLNLIGNFEWQLVTGKLEPSGYTFPNLIMNMLQQNCIF